MPIYEYRCRDCRRRVQVITLRVSERVEPTCDRCGSRDLDRLLSRFAMPRSEERRLESLADPSRLSGLDENDPGSVARWMRRMGQEAGEDLGGDEVDQIADEIASSGDDD
jgi:putative FmdB family regulatory protein